VLALPGRVDHPMAAGCHRLIREGAELVERPSEVLVALGRAPPDSSRRVAQDEPPPTDELQRALLAALTGETLDVEELAGRASRAVTAILPALIELELAGRVARGPGGLYRRVGG
jgi:DNA processing protein